MSLTDTEILERADQLRRAAKEGLKQKVAGWVALAAFVAGLLLAVLFGGNEQHQSGLLVFVVALPVFLLQVILLAAAGAFVNWLLAWVRAQGWYDKHGAAQELGIIRARIGTPQEKEGDGNAAGRQFLASTVLIATVILAFFLTRIQ